jgi:hypothetical protein
MDRLGQHRLMLISLPEPFSFAERCVGRSVADKIGSMPHSRKDEAKHKEIHALAGEILARWHDAFDPVKIRKLAHLTAPFHYMAEDSNLMTTQLERYERLVRWKEKKAALSRMHGAITHLSSWASMVYPD